MQRRARALVQRSRFAGKRSTPARASANPPAAAHAQQRCAIAPRLATPSAADFPRCSARSAQQRGARAQNARWGSQRAMRLAACVRAAPACISRDGVWRQLMQAHILSSSAKTRLHACTLVHGDGPRPCVVQACARRLRADRCCCTVLLGRRQQPAGQPTFTPVRRRRHIAPAVGCSRAERAAAPPRRRRVR